MKTLSLLIYAILGTQVLAVGQTPTSSSKYMDYKSQRIENKVLNVTRTGIYKFRFANGAITGRVCSYKIQRIPGNKATKDFNSNVYWKTVYDTTYTIEQEDYLIKKEYITNSIVPLSKHYINSGSNATFKGGVSRISIPVILPPNTQEWYYEFSASRNPEDIENVMSTTSLVSQLTNVIDQTGVLGFGIDMLTQPPGGNVCNIYLLDFENSRLFEAKNQYRYFPFGSRENIESGIVKLDKGSNETVYLGIMNPDATHGIHVAIEVVAITLNEEWGKRDIEKMNVASNEVPYLKN